MPSKEKPQQQTYFVHDLINKLSAIIGHCDLLKERIELGAEYAKRVNMIRDLADSAARELAEHQRKLANEIRKAG